MPHHLSLEHQKHALCSVRCTHLSPAEVGKLVNFSICAGDPCGQLIASASFSQGFGSARNFYLFLFFFQQLRLNEWLTICGSFVLGPEPIEYKKAARKSCIWGLTYL